MENTIKQKKILHVTIVNMTMNTLLAIAKIFFGATGHSQALIADGIHSFSDLISDALVYVTAHASTLSPDEEHPYGHQRIETIGAIAISLLLLSIAFSIGYEAALRLLHPTSLLKPTISVLIVAALSILINEGLFYYSNKLGKKIHSTLLINNAWHKRSDSFISIIVLLSILGGFIGWRWLDPIGALFITILIFKMAIEMIWHAAQELIDRAVDEKKLAEIKNTINSVAGVQSIHQLRTRLHGSSIFVDLHIIVDPFISVSEGHHIGEQVHQKLINNVKNLMDVTVHIDPENDESAHPSVHLPNREAVKKILASRWSSLPEYNHIKKMTLHYLEGRLYIEIYIAQNGMQNPNDLLSLYRDATRDIQYMASVVIHWMPK